jgi:hypothetical protein
MGVLDDLRGVWPAHYLENEYLGESVQTMIVHVEIAELFSTRKNLE